MTDALGRLDQYRLAIDHTQDIAFGARAGASAAAEAFERDELSTIVAKVEAVGPDHYGMDMKLPENAFRFQRYIRERIKNQN